MKRSVLIIAISLFVLMGVSDTGKQLTADVSVSNMTGSPQMNIVAPFHLNTSALMESGAIGDDGLSMEMQNSALAEVPFAPGPTWTAMEACQSNNGGAFADDTTDCNDAGVGDTLLIPNTGADLEVGDSWHAGAHWPFRILRVDLSTAGVFVTSPAIAWEYCSTGGASCTVWTALENVVDNTAGFTEAGQHSITWDMPDDWEDATQNAVTSFYVRARVTALVASANYTAAPLATQAHYQMGIGFLYACDTCDSTDIAFSALSLANNQSVPYELFTGQDTPRTLHHYFPGEAGIVPESNITSPSAATNAVFSITGLFSPAASGSARNLIASTGGSDNITVSWDSAVDGAIDVVTTGMVDNCVIANAATGITSTRTHELEFQFDETGNECHLVVDGVTVASEATNGAFTNTGATWEFIADGSVFALESFKYAAGSLDPDVSTDNNWALEDLSTFTALSMADTVGAISATPSFPLITDGLVATVDSFMSATSSAATPPDEAPADILGVIDAPVRFAVIAQPTVSLPGHEVVTELTTEAGMPPYLIWVFGGAVVSIIALVLVFKATQSFMLALMAASMVVAGVFSLTIFPFWVLIPVIVIGFAIIVFGKGLVIGA